LFSLAAINTQPDTIPENRDNLGQTILPGSPVWRNKFRDEVKGEKEPERKKNLSKLMRVRMREWNL